MELITTRSELPELERAVVEVVGGCNYKCAMCPQTTGRGREWTRKMSLDMFEGILKQLPGKPVINLEGSGEPSMAKDLDQYVQLCTDYGFDSFMYTNGSFLTGDLLERVVDAGITFIRYSCIGYNRETYNEWMATDRFEALKDNIREAKQVIAKKSSNCTLSSYHLVLDNNQIEYELEQYRQNFVDDLGIIGYIWKMHNWSGNYDPVYDRSSEHVRTCGRPFANEITIRSGGINGRRGAVTPCCQTMGPPNEALSVLGHADTQSLADIWHGEKYQALREAHRAGDYPDYCKSCDFLYDNPEVLVWSNDPEARVNWMLGTKSQLR